MLKIGIIREGKNPPDKRVPFTPQQTEEIEQRFPHMKVTVQASNVRCFNDKEYSEAGVQVSDSVNNCDVLMGIKEVPVDQLIPNKVYLFFSHTIKKQPYNKKLLQEILKKKIRLIDYETLTDRLGNRMVERIVVAVRLAVGLAIAGLGGLLFWASLGSVNMMM